MKADTPDTTFAESLRAQLTSIENEVRQLRREFAEIREPILRVATKKDSRKQQAKRAGCHPSTLWRRERRERIRLMADGRIEP